MKGGGMDMPFMKGMVDMPFNMAAAPAENMEAGFNNTPPMDMQRSLQQSDMHSQRDFGENASFFSPENGIDHFSFSIHR